MKVSIDQSRCTGHGLCYTHAPDVFVDDDQGYGEVLAATPTDPALIAAARDAVANCPERAISVEE